MKKQYRLLTIGLILAFIVAACGGGGESASTTAAAETTTTVAAETTTTAAVTTTAGVTTTLAALPDLGGRAVTVGLENAYLPFNYIPVGGTEGEGWDYDAWRYICGLLNCVPEFVESAWPAVIDQVAQGELDTAADGISITDERKEVVDYSDPYMVVEQKFIVQLNDDRYATAQALIDDPKAIVATQIGTTNLELATSLVGEDRVKAYDQFPLAVQALIAGDVDAVIIDDAAGLGYVGVNADQIKAIDDGLQSDPLGFIFPKGSDLVGPVNQAIQVMKDDGTMEELGIKFFTDAFVITYEDIEEVG